MAVAMDTVAATAKRDCITNIGRLNLRGPLLCRVGLQANDR